MESVMAFHSFLRQCRLSRLICGDCLAANESLDAQAQAPQSEENRDVASENPELVAKISKIADSIRHVLGDRLTGVKGSEVRPVGRIEN